TGAGPSTAPYVLPSSSALFGRSSVAIDIAAFSCWRTPSAIAIISLQSDRRDRWKMVRYSLVPGRDTVMAPRIRPQFRVSVPGKLSAERGFLSRREVDL